MPNPFFAHPILNSGTEPSELPVQAPIKFELVINIKTARLVLSLPAAFPPSRRSIGPAHGIDPSYVCGWNRSRDGHVCTSGECLKHAEPITQWVSQALAASRPSLGCGDDCAYRFLLITGTTAWLLGERPVTASAGPGSAHTSADR